MRQQLAQHALGWPAGAGAASWRQRRSWQHIVAPHTRHSAGSAGFWPQNRHRSSTRARNSSCTCAVG